MSVFAAGGAAVVTVGETPVLRDSGITHPHMLMVADPDLMAYLSKVTDAIHRHQAHASIELCHGGAASPDITTAASRLWVRQKVYVLLTGLL